MKRDVLEKEIKGYKVEIEALDYEQEGDYINLLDKLYEVLQDMKGEEDKDYSELIKRQRAIVIDLLKIPTIKIDGELLDDVPYFIKKIGEVTANSLIYEIKTFDLLSEEEEGK